LGVEETGIENGDEKKRSKEEGKHEYDEIQVNSRYSDQSVSDKMMVLRSLYS
jgi:hypothetical protein